MTHLAIPFQQSQKLIHTTIFQVFTASLWLALCAQISIPLPFSLVPITGQTLGVMLIGLTLGRRLGFLSVLAYLIEGSLGLPFFAAGGCGVMQLVGPKGGYFLGMLAQVYLIGHFKEKSVKLSSVKMMLVLLISTCVQLSLGVAILSLFIGLHAALMMGFVPFILTESAKIALVASCFDLFSKSKNVFKFNC